jgi:hypothetical protein
MTITTILAYLGVILAVLAAGLFLLPAKAHVERSAVIPADAPSIYPYLSSSAGFDRFNPFKEEDPTTKISFSGPDSGVGSSFRWEAKSGNGSQTIIALEENRSVTMQLDLGPMGQPRQSFTLEPAQGGTRVTWALDADLSGFPVKRVFGLFMDGMLGKKYESGLRKLAEIARG